VLELEYDTDAGVYVAEGAIGAAAAGAEVGVSFVQLVRDDNGALSATLLSGDGLSADLQYSEQLALDLPAFAPLSAATGQVESGPVGYNPLMTRTVNSTVVCARAHRSPLCPPPQFALPPLYICSNTTTCVVPLVAAVPSTETSDTVCINATSVCSSMEFFNLTTLSCQPLRSCVLFNTYEVVPPTLTSDRICVATTSCSFSLEFIRRNATLTSDRVCALVRQCSGNQVERVPPTQYSNRQCASAQIQENAAASLGDERYALYGAAIILLACLMIVICTRRGERDMTLLHVFANLDVIFISWIVLVALLINPTTEVDIETSDNTCRAVGMVLHLLSIASSV
jgi:hypothetical protein